MFGPSDKKPLGENNVVSIPSYYRWLWNAKVGLTVQLEWFTPGSPRLVSSVIETKT
jgi:hypothetical protein